MHLPYKIIKMEKKMSEKYKNRVILVSDMHYTTEESYSELKLKYPNAKTSVAAGNAFGYTQSEKVKCIVDDINEFAKKNPIDSVLVLGDLSLDDYSYRNLPCNYCVKFKSECMEKMPCKAFAIPGNHDSYPNELWKEIFGYDRQYSLKINGAAFIMLDTFNSSPASDASGSAYTGVDLHFLKTELKKYPTEQIFICAHYLAFDENRKELDTMLNGLNRIVCLFDAHTHTNKLYLPEENRKHYQINVGGYGYSGEILDDGKLHFDRFQEAWSWGYEVLEWNEKSAHLYHVKPARRYVGYNGVFDYKGAIEDEITLDF